MLVEVLGYVVNLENVVVWIISEMRLYGLFFDDIVFNLKIDGRFFFGKCVRSIILSLINLSMILMVSFFDFV